MEISAHILNPFEIQGLKNFFLMYLYSGQIMNNELTQEIVHFFRGSI